MISRGLDASFIRFGTSSFSSKDWIGPFYPRGTSPRDFLPFYATRFDTVEIDATYYAIPAPAIVESWSARTPPNFLFAAKFPREIVHGGMGPQPDPKRLLLPDTTYRARDAFLEVMRILGTAAWTSRAPVSVHEHASLSPSRSVLGTSRSFSL